MAAAVQSIRRARPGDALAIRALLEELGYRPDARLAGETIAHVTRHPEMAVFVAVEGVEVIGFISVSHRPQIRLAGRLATIDELVVAPSRRGRGIGSGLLDAALQHARGLQCSRVELTQTRARESYQRGFYADRGFVEAPSAILRLDLDLTPPTGTTPPRGIGQRQNGR